MGKESGKKTCLNQAPYKRLGSLHSMALLSSHFSPVSLNSILEYNVLRIRFQSNNSALGSLFLMFRCTFLGNCAYGSQPLSVMGGLCSRPLSAD